MNIKSLITACVLGIFATAAHAEIKEGTDYVLLKKPIPQLNADKIEVTQFFAYFCIHCKNLDPVLLQHSRSFPQDTYLRNVHVVWDENAITMARIAAAVNASGTLYQANPAIFDAMFTRGADNRPTYNLNDPATFKSWAASKGAWGNAVVRAFDSPTNLAEAKNMEKMTFEYGINSTPQVMVGGKYQLNLSNNFAADMSRLDELIAKVRKERNMATPKAKKATLGAGAALAVQANQ
ncbi:MAG: thiol:disulfide interchange protein DsbA/DsbL [Neisseria sp.]|nr:thiol:disulfide interchange protein DsbA/DsbL [Neisseria sp.]